MMLTDLEDPGELLRFHVARVLVERDVDTRYLRGIGKVPTINVKCYADLTDAQFQEVRRELPGKYRRGFTREYLKNADPDYVHYSSAAERAWEMAQDEASAIFGKVTVHSDGRSGGWLVVKGLPDTEESPEEWTFIQRFWPSASLCWQCGDLELGDNDTLLHRWRFYCALAAVNVADMPRAHACQIAFNKYLPECEERSKKRKKTS
jgi:hypothetical protein